MAETFPRGGFPEVNFVEVDPEVIKSEIITGFEKVNGQALAPGDPRRLFLLSIADRIIQLKNSINISGQQNLLTYAQGGNLDALGILLSAPRLEASPALTTLEFELTEAMAVQVIIPQGFEVTNGIVTFATDKELIIAAGELRGTVGATCTTAGVEGNDYLPGQISTIVKPMAYVRGVENITTTSSGANAEDDEAYAERLQLATDSYSVAGPEAAYKFHARSVSSAIIDANVVSPSPCVVNIYPLVTGGKLPSDDLLAKINAYFKQENIVPMCDFPTALVPDVINYTVNVDYYIAPEDFKRSETIHEDVEKAVNEYILWQQSKVGRALNPDNLIYNVKKAGAFRIDLSTLSPADYIEIAGNQVAQCTKITINRVEDIEDENN
jgi:phage-related baseplate assembly protein